MPYAYLVYNPTAGRVPIRPFINRAKAVLEEHGWEINLQATQSANHITTLAREAAQANADAFFIAGGDGSINLATAGLMGSRTALGVLPAGTANVLAQDLHLPTPSLTRWDAVEESARRLANAPAYWADVGICNDRPFLMWAGVGLDAVIVNEVEPRSRWEKPFTFPQYVLSAIKNTASWSGLRLEVETDGQQVEGTFVLAVATNIRRYAGGVTEISPDAYLDDGEMDLWLFYAENLADIAQRLLEVLTHKHLHSEGVARLRFRQARLSGERPLVMHTDGEPNGEAHQIWITVRPRALRLLVPPGGETLFRYASEDVTYDKGTH
ncbi:MAG: YegS/Rv2252/BmrU family lipid kinase [Chloroflexi bacterium]|nr:YegS/Rv2252/BmrU family lipid kinase [Chloroflexota bacterium]